MQSNQLDADVKERVEKAIAKLGFRVTVGQIAAAAGVKLSEAEQALKALAYDSLGNLEVSSHSGQWPLVVVTLNGYGFVI
jgi:ribosomal protein S25